MRIEEHEKALGEHEKNIKRCIDEGIEENQRNVGYNASQASIEMLSIYLLKLKLVPVSVNFDHRIFKSSASVKSALSFDFPEKFRILDLMKKIDFYNELKDIIGDISWKTTE